MRVLLVANTLPPTDVSGVGEQVLQLAAGLRAAGHRVEVLGRGEGGARGPKLLFPFSIVLPFLAAVRRFRPHVVQVHESDGALAALALKTVAATLRPVPLLVALLQVSYVEEIRAVRPVRDRGRVLGRPGASELVFRYLKAPVQVAFGCLTAWLADRVLSPSRATADEVERDYGVRGVSVLPNVTGGREVEPAPPSEEPTGDYLLFVGRLRVRKGVEVLVEAVRSLAPEFGDLRLKVAGDGEQLASLAEMVGRLGLDGKVELLGRCDASRVRRLLAGARSLVVPSLYEGMPLVVLEAMEAGTPVVASAVSGIPEVVDDGRTGWLVPAEDAAALAAALRHAWRDPAEAHRRGGEGQRKLQELFRPEAAVRAWRRAIPVRPSQPKEEGSDDRS